MGVFGHKSALGFWLADDGLEASLIWPKRKGWKLAGEAAVHEPGLLVGEDRKSRLEKAFRLCQRKLPSVARRADQAAVLALPDGWVEEDVLSFAEFPKSGKEARALVAHRMARELSATPDRLVVSWDAFPGQGDGMTCRVRAMDKALRDDIDNAASAAGIRLVRCEGWSCFASGAAHLASFDSGAALWSDGRDWSLLCWAKADPVGFCQHGNATDQGQAVSDVVRLCGSYARAWGMTGLDLVLDVPSAFQIVLADTAAAAGLSVHATGASQQRRSAQVAAWG